MTDTVVELVATHGLGSHPQDGRRAGMTIVLLDVALANARRGATVRFHSPTEGTATEAFGDACALVNSQSPAPGTKIRSYLRQPGALRGSIVLPGPDEAAHPGIVLFFHGDNIGPGHAAPHLTIHDGGPASRITHHWRSTPTEGDTPA
jgi:hypothetical protein